MLYFSSNMPRFLSSGDAKSLSSNTDQLDESSASTYCGTEGSFPVYSPVAMHMAPTPDDIIVGSRGTHHSGPGNDRFNQMIDSFIPKYTKASTKAEKGKIFAEIYQTVSCFGRFLCSDANTGLFYEVGDYVAKEKISHALRYRKKRMNKKKQSAAPARASLTSLGGVLAAQRKSRFQEVVANRLHHGQPKPAPPMSLKTYDPELFSDEDLASVLGGHQDWPNLAELDDSFSLGGFAAL